MTRRPTARTVARVGHAVSIGAIALAAWQILDAMTSYVPGFNDPHGYTIVFGAMTLGLLVPLLAVGMFGYARAWIRGRSTALELFDLGAVLLAVVVLRVGIDNATFLGGFDLAYLPGIAVAGGFVIVTIGSFAALRRSARPAR